MVYFAIVGGAAALETTQIEEIEEVAWEEPDARVPLEVPRQGLRPAVGRHRLARQLALPRRPGARRRRSWRSSMPSFDGFLDVPRARPSRARRPDPRDRQGPRPARHRGPLRDGRRLRRHRQARLGHVVRDAATSRRRSRSTARSTRRSSAAARSSRRSMRRDRLDEYKRWLQRPRASRTSRSRTAAIEMPRERKLELIADFARDFTVLSEVGSKDAEVVYAPYQWVDWMQEELAAGAWKVITEGREGGTAGIYRPDRRDAHRARRRDRPLDRPRATSSSRRRRSPLRPGSSSSSAPT